MKSLEKETINIDFTASGIPDAVKNFRPYVYKDGDKYYCILGADKEQGIFGTGDTAELAMQDWERALNEKKQK
jgi:hypothetical protein